MSTPLSDAGLLELHALADAALAGNLSDEQRARLESLVLEDQALRKLYVRYMYVSWNLRAWAKFPLAGDEQFQPIEADTDVFPPPPLVHGMTDVRGSWFTLQSQFGSALFSYAVSILVICLALLGAWAYKISHNCDLNIADNNRRSTPSGQHEFVVVGRITGMVDCRWSDPATQTVIGAAVSLDRQYALASGLLEITYTSGVKVILSGPCNYKADSPAGGFLELGKLTARVETKSDVGSRDSEKSVQNNNSTFHLPPSAFVVTTPTVTITDLGTEFFVDVASTGAVEVHVIQGKVLTTWKSSTRNSLLESRLAAGEAQRFDHAGAQPRTILYKSPWTTNDSFKAIYSARQSKLLRPVGLMATAYHRVWDADGNHLVDGDRAAAFRVTTDGRFGRGANDEGPRSSFDTQTNEGSPTAFVGLRYAHRVRIDRIKVFLGHQFADGGVWRRMPRVFILKTPVDTGSMSPEDDPRNWRELPTLNELYGTFDEKVGVNPGEVIEVLLNEYPESDRTGYGWALVGEGGGEMKYISVTELRAYGAKVTEQSQP